MPERKVIPYRDLLFEIAPGEWVIDNDRCYICGADNFAGDHLNENGWPTHCPTGITRAEADKIRAGRDEEVR